jgi:hypothetical protein
MWRCRGTIAVGVALLGCATPATPRGPQGDAPADLRADIAARVEADQTVQRLLGERIQAGAGVAAAEVRRDSVFAANLEWMRGILARYGWPGRRLVGEDGSHGAWLLLQHADRDTALQRTALRLLGEAVRVDDASARDFAYLTDRVRIAEGRPQIYGTQLQYDSHGCASPRPTENPAQLDARRATVGLDPMTQYLERTMTALGRSTQCPSAR